MASQSTNYYNTHPEAKKKKQEYARKRNQTREEKLNIAAHTRKSRKEGTYGNGDNKDWSKTASGWVQASQKDNRAKKGIHKPRRRGTA